MRTVIVDSLGDLAAHADPWNRLAVRAQPAGALPMQAYAWVSSYLEHRLAADASWFCVLAYEGDELVGAAPLVMRHATQLGRSHAVLTSPRDDHTFGAGPLAAPGHERLAIGALVDAAARHDERWRYLELSRVLADSASTRAMRARRRTPVTERFESRGAYLPTVGDFADYRAGLSRNFRNNLNKAANKLRKLGDVKFSFLEGEQAAPSVLSHLMAVEASGWKGREGTAIANDPDLVEFYTALVQRLWEARLLEWHLLEADGEVLAANLAVRFGATVLAWKLGYDEAHRRCSPGNLLFEKLAERAFADPDIDEINLSTDQPWYDNWAMDKRDYIDARVHLLRPGSLLLSYLPQRAKSRLRGMPAARRLIERLRR